MKRILLLVTAALVMAAMMVAMAAAAFAQPGGGDPPRTDVDELQECIRLANAIGGPGAEEECTENNTPRLERSDPQYRCVRGDKEEEVRYAYTEEQKKRLEQQGYTC